MKNFFLPALVLGAGVLSSQALSYDQNITPNAIYGGGNANGFWTVDQANDTEVGLRAKIRGENVYPSNGDGTYNFATGFSSGTAALWNFDFSINSNLDGIGERNLDSVAIALSVDTDPSQGQNWVTVSPFAVWKDNSFGNNGTTQGGGHEYNDFAAQSAGLDEWNVVQNSQNLGWMIPGFDANVDGTYDFMLSVSDESGVLASTAIQVIVGDGGAPVPEGGSSIALLGLGALALCGLGLRKQVA